MDVIAYFQSYKDYFWEWTTDEDVPDASGYGENNLISIPNVGPIAYRHYIIEILKELQQVGFPSFGSFLLVLYALQDGNSNIDGIIYHLKRHSGKQFGKDLNNDYELAIKFLENINHVTIPFKRGQNKINLLQTIFKNSHNQISSIRSELIIKRFEKSPIIIAKSAEKEELTQSVLSNDIKTLALLKHKFPTTKSIIEAVNGIVEITELEDEVIEKETTFETDKDFIQQLIEEPKTFQVGSLIKRIWSGLKIPMRHLSPGEQPIGGVSDMTNKGDLHRMLLSEFANEDEVFMNRIANNEALYIQREIPPEENIFERIILIDTSLKNWGTPKVLSFASAIAVIKHPKAHSECKVFALGQTNVPISLNKMEDVVENLNQVSPVLEVSQALKKFFNEEHTEKDLEVFFITNQENIENQNIQKVIHENRDRLKFLVTTSATGELNFYKYHNGTRKHIQKIVLPLKELWANPPQKKQEKQDNSANSKKADLPLNYPLLFPTPLHRIATFLYEGEFFILSNKKQLLKTYLSSNYYDRNHYDHFKIHRGCEVLFEDISIKPKGKFALARNRQQHYILCQFDGDKHIISKLNLNTKEYSELNLTGKNITYKSELIYFNKYFYLLNDDEKIYSFNTEGNISSEYVINENIISKHHSKVKIELDKLNKSGITILSNFNKIGINTQNNLVVSGNELIIGEDPSLKLHKNRYDITLFAYQNKNRFIFSDGSEIITDTRGMLTFKSSNNSIPTFYIPSTVYGNLSISSNAEFGGSEYYLPESSLLKLKKIEEMYSKYLRAFIDIILDYAVDN